MEMCTSLFSGIIGSVGTVGAVGRSSPRMVDQRTDAENIPLRNYHCWVFLPSSFPFPYPTKRIHGQFPRGKEDASEAER